MVSFVFIFLVPLLVTCKEVKLPADCNGIHKEDKLPSGVYTIYPSGTTSAIQVSKLGLFQRI